MPVKIHLISVHPTPSPQSVPLANAFLKAFAVASGVTIALIDLYLGQGIEACATRILDSNPSAVGFSLYVWNRQQCLQIARELRCQQPSITLFCGGPEATADPDGILHERIFGYVFVGEGEVPFGEFCQRLTDNQTIVDIPGIVTPEQPSARPNIPLSDLDSIPSPYLSGVLALNDRSGLLWQLSRGCAFSCDFCFDARGTRGVRRFSVERVESELRFFAASSVAQIFVLDSTFNQDLKRAKKILKLITKISPDIHFHFEVRSEFIDTELAELFAEITCSLQIGLQSANPSVLKQVGRTFNKADFSSRIGLLNDSGAVFGFDLIYGLPEDTLAGFCSSLDYALSLYPNHLDIFPLSVLPGTRLAQRATELDLCWRKEPPYTLICTDSFSVDDMASAAQLATACDIFYTRGKAVAWFNSVAHLLALKPSQLFRAFSNWLEHMCGSGRVESDFDDDEIWQMQKSFLQQLFTPKQFARFLPLVLDLVDYHHYYAATLLAAGPAPDRHMVPSGKLRTTVFTPALSTHLVQFTYEIEELLDCQSTDIRWMYTQLSPVGSQAAIYPHNGTVCTESLDSSYMALLKQMNGTHTAGDIFKSVGLSYDEAFDFLTFAQQEGIIVASME